MRKYFTHLCLSLLASMISTTAWALEPNSDGIYEIANKDDLVAFSALVNGGQANINAVLTADIDMSDVNGYVPIGNDANRYCGTFDGQGHRIMSLKIKGEQFLGVFGIVTGGAVIKNFILDENSAIEGTEDAGLVGSTRGSGKVTLQCLGNEADITIKGTNAGGILGDNDDTQATIYMERCFYTGDIESAGNSATMCGWIGLGGTIYDSYSIASVEGYESEEKAFTRRKGSTDLANCYSNFGTQVTPTNKEEALSGRLAWMLNGETFVSPKFFQTLGEEPHPVPFASSQVVYKYGDTFASFTPADASSFAEARENIVFAETQAYSDVLAYKPFVENYLATVNSWTSMTNYEEFCSSYSDAQTLKSQLSASITAYGKYVERCKYILGYLQDNIFSNDARTTLESYLEDVVEPGAFPNGSYAFIIDACNLNDEQIAAETEYVSQMFNSAIADNFVAGTEITKMMQNPDFKDDWEGWTVESNAPSGMQIGGVPEIMKIARGQHNTYTVEQTIKGIPNGIYMMNVNALMRPAGEDACTFYAGQLFLNGNVNYVMSISEDPIPTSKAVDQVNSSTADDHTISVNGVDCYIPSNMNGCSYAFNSGRYTNYVAVEVKDNTLTVGVRSLGTGQKGDWLPFGNIHVFFLGQAEEATTQLSDVLTGYVARAKTIQNFEASLTDYALYPNIPAAQKTQLTELTAQAENVTAGADKMNLINSFSTLFDEIYAARKAYIELARAGSTVTDFAGELLSMQIISTEEYHQISSESGAALDAYSNGTKTTDEALAISNQLISDYISPYVPYADNWYQIYTPTQLYYVFILINSGAANADVMLMKDIDLTAYNIQLKKFGGTLDGQGHTVTINRTGNSEEGNAPLIYELTGTVQNMGLAGTIVANSKNLASFTAYHYGVLSRCVSTVTILPQFSGDITGGGLIARGQTGGRVEDCLFAGKIVRSDAIKAGGICGWVSGNTDFVNCMAIGELDVQIDNTSYAIARNSNKKGTITNCYYMAGFGGRIDEGAIAITPEQLESGELAYTLGWGQELGKDEYPSPICPMKVIKKDDGTYENEGTEPVEPTAPKADILDVVFNEDGSAEDVSPMHNTVEHVGTTSSVYFNETYQRNVARFENPWSKTCTGYYKVDYETNDAIRSALADGHSLEMLVMPDYEGALQDVEAKPFSAMQGGGTGFLVCKTNASGSGGKNVFTFLPNVTESGNSTWRWVTSGVVPAPKTYYHVVGVWNKEEAKAYIYVNGELCNTVDAPGQFRFANSGCNWFCIGGDADHNGGGQGWTGDVAIARAYDKSLTGEEVALLWNSIPSGVATISEDAAPFGIFRLDGVRVEKAQQGIYIINGKKVLVK